MARRLVVVGILALLLTPPAWAQEAGSDRVCGPRCIQRILQHYGIRADLVDLIKEVQESDVNRGASLAELRRALKTRGIHCRYGKAAFLVVPEATQPVILHINGNHFVVLEGWDGSEAIIWDGLNGSRSIPWWRLQAECSGTILMTSGSEWGEGNSGVRDYRIFALLSGALIVVVGGILLIRSLRQSIRRPWNSSLFASMSYPRGRMK